jgi:hypothetical protein
VFFYILRYSRSLGETLAMKRNFFIIIKRKRGELHWGEEERERREEEEEKKRGKTFLSHTSFLLLPPSLLSLPDNTLISDAHEWINEIPTVPIYYLANPQPRERAWQNQRGKKTLLSLTLVRQCEKT